jgi:hypothetical protein
MSEQCSAHHENGKQCRATRCLTRAVVTLNGKQGGTLVLPEVVTVLLCPKHFVFREVSG